MFSFQDTRGSIDVAFTDRHGGVGRRGSLNLADAHGDAHDAVEENIDIVVCALARGTEPVDDDDPLHLPPGTRVPEVVGMRQVHGADVHVVDGDARRRSSPPEPRVADALVTALPGVILMVRMADCVPVLLADVSRGLVGAAHAGRPGMVAGVVPNTVAAMRELGAMELVAWIGPHVCGNCYEVPELMRSEVSAVVPESFAQTSWGTPALDIGAGVRAQLAASGVEVVDASRCTMEDENLYSHRRQGKESGRMAGLVWVRP